MHPRNLTVGLMSVCLALVVGCGALQGTTRPDTAWDGNLVKVGYGMADKLADNAAQSIGPSDTKLRSNIEV